MWFLAYALAIFTEYTAWAAFGEVSGSTLEIILDFFVISQSEQICKWSIKYAHLVTTDHMGSTCAHPYPHTKFHHCSPYKTLDIWFFLLSVVVVGKHSSCGLPNWVTDKTTKLKLERDEAKKRYIVSKSKQSRACWRRLNSELNESYKLDEAAMLNKQIEDLKLADTKGDYTTTWKIIHELSGKGKKTSVKVKKRDGTPPTSDKELLSEWKEYFSSLLNNCSGQSSSELPLPAAQDLQIQTDPPTRDETVLAISQMKTNKAAGLDAAITAEALQNGGVAMIDVVHRFCAEVYSSLTTTQPMDNKCYCAFTQEGRP